jgi:hypothetical protein
MVAITWTTLPVDNFRRPSRFILNDEGEPEPCPDLLKWASGLETNDRKVARTELPNSRVVSTVFLGLDHGYPPGPVLLFETMLFDYSGGARPEYDICKRYSTRHDALVGHEELVAWLQSSSSRPSALR